MPTSDSAPSPPSARSTVKRAPARARYDREAVHAVLDEGLVAHVGIAVDGQPFVIPMSYGRDGDRMILHGSVASRLLRDLDRGVPVCATVTLVDGLVFARSTFHHSMNYRSVVVLGTARRLTRPTDAAAALDVLVEHLVPGRTGEARPPSPSELRRTTVLELPIHEASVKARTGGAVDESDDLDLPVWAGVVPLRLTPGVPVTDPDVAAGVPVPPTARGWTRLPVPAL